MERTSAAPHAATAAHSFAQVIREREGDYSYSVALSIVEVYNENVRDLLEVNSVASSVARAACPAHARATCSARPSRGAVRHGRLAAVCACTAAAAAATEKPGRAHATLRVAPRRSG
jgi:hypothetical protein